LILVDFPQLPLIRRTANFEFFLEMNIYDEYCREITAGLPSLREVVVFFRTTKDIRLELGIHPEGTKRRSKSQ